MANVYTPINSSYKLAFDDEFNGTSLNTSVWQPGWFASSGLSGPANSAETAVYNSSQVSVSGGDLHLTAIASPATRNGKTYPDQTGTVTSGFDYTVWIFQSRVYLPAASPGVIANWPSWWLDGQNSPNDGEIDVLEGLGGKAGYHFHYSGGGPGGSASGDFTGWHVFGALWKPGEIDWYYDGQLEYKQTTGVTSSPMMMILNNGIGQYGGPTVTPSDMLVDYVHVYQTGPNATAVTPQAGYGGPGDTGGGTVTPPPPPPPPPPTTSPDGTKITAGIGRPPIVDASGNSWSLVQSSTSSKGLQIAVNGTIDAVTHNVTVVEYVGGRIYQENTAGEWYTSHSQIARGCKRPIRLERCRLISWSCRCQRMPTTETRSLLRKWTASKSLAPQQ